MFRAATAAVVACAALALPASGASAAQPCSNFQTTVFGGGVDVSRLHASGVGCGTAHTVAQEWLDGFSNGTGDQYCAPPAGDGPATCSVGRWHCRARGVSGATADNVSCRLGRHSMAWRADFDQEPGPGADTGGQRSG